MVTLEQVAALTSAMREAGVIEVADEIDKFYLENRDNLTWASEEGVAVIANFVLLLAQEVTSEIAQEGGFYLQLLNVEEALGEV